MAARPYILEETTWRSVSGRACELAVLPWGATEAHNYHLPYGTDTIETNAVAAEAARLAEEANARVIVLPAVPFGVQTGQRDIPFCLNLNPSTQALVLRDLVQSMEPHGIRKIVLLNGHGGNDFRAMIRELQPQVSTFLCTINWYSCVDPAGFFDQPGDHGGELETSVMMHIASDLVRPLSEAGDGAARPWRIAGLREGWAWAPRQWTRMSADTGVGNPALASAEKGERYFAAVTTRIAAFLRDLAAADSDALYGDPV